MSIQELPQNAALFTWYPGVRCIMCYDLSLITFMLNWNSRNDMEIILMYYGLPLNTFMLRDLYLPLIYSYFKLLIQVL